MDLAQLQSWVAHLEQLKQADLPMDFAGLIMTPRQLLQHALANDNVWKQIKNRI